MYFDHVTVYVLPVVAVVVAILLNSYPTCGREPFRRGMDGGFLFGIPSLLCSFKIPTNGFQAKCVSVSNL